MVTLLAISAIYLALLPFSFASYAGSSSGAQPAATSGCIHLNGRLSGRHGRPFGGRGQDVPRSAAMICSVLPDQ
jgi:hypothetical protein